MRKKWMAIGAGFGIIILILVIATSNNFANPQNKVSQESNQKTNDADLQSTPNVQPQDTQSHGTQSQNTQQETTKSPTGLSKTDLEILANTNPLIKGLMTGQINFFIDPVPSYAAPGVADMMEKIANLLGTIGNGQVKLNRVYDENDADIHITWIRDFGGDPVGLTNFRSIVQIGLGMQNCYGDWEAFDAQTVLKILAHELGHAMGFKHDSDPNNIMYPTIDTKFYTDYEKSITLNTGYYVPVQFCGGGTYYYDVSTDDKYNGFDVYVTPPDSTYEGIISGKDLYYSSCSSSNMISYSHTCTVQTGSKIWIYNHESSNSKPDQIKVRIVDQNQPSIPDFTWKDEDSIYDKQTLDYVWNMFH